MFGLVIALLVAGLGLALVFEQRRGISRQGQKLPRPPGTLPLAGYGIWFLQPRQRLLDWLVEIQPIMGLRTHEVIVPSLPPAVLINDPKNLEFVLKDINLFVKGDFFQSRSWDLFANGILNADGDLWRIQRKAGLRFLSTSNLKYFMDEMLPKFLDDFRERLDTASQLETTIDLQNELLRVTTRLFGKVAYDMDIDPSMPFSQAFEFASAKTNARFTNPLWRVTDYLLGWRFHVAVEQVRAFGASVVSSANAQLQTTPERSGPLRNSLIKSLLMHIPDQKTVADSATNFLSAGRDTTAQSMSWALYELLKHPGITAKVVESLKAAFPGKSRSEPLHIGFEDASSAQFLTYLNAVFAESLRLNPAIPFEIKETTAQCTLPDGTELPRGAVVIWIPYSMARNELIWGSDANVFAPQRWIGRDAENQDTIIQKNAFENPVFNAGPRMCIGKRMAEVLAVKVLAECIWRWEFTLDGPPRVVDESLTAPMKDGLPVKVRRVAIAQKSQRE